MLPERSDIINRLRKEILVLNGSKPFRHTRPVKPVLGPIHDAFPDAQFPLGCLHEIISRDAADRSAAIGFLSVIISSFLENGVILWVSPKERIFPAALRYFSLDPSQIISIRSQKPKELAWTIEEALKCRSLSVVVGEMKEMDFNTSRRLQLAVEESRVTAFILREGSKIKTNTASTARWMISHLPSLTVDDMPGIGFPCWSVHLEKLKNAKPCSWDVVFQKGKIEELTTERGEAIELKRKTV